MFSWQDQGERVFGYLKHGKHDVLSITNKNNPQNCINSLITSYVRWITMKVVDSCMFLSWWLLKVQVQHGNNQFNCRKHLAGSESSASYGDKKEPISRFS